jgi:hypothetical protein
MQTTTTSTLQKKKKKRTENRPTYLILRDNCIRLVQPGRNRSMGSCKNQQQQEKTTKMSKTNRGRNTGASTPALKRVLRQLTVGNALVIATETRTRTERHVANFRRMVGALVHQVGGVLGQEGLGFVLGILSTITVVPLTTNARKNQISGNFERARKQTKRA